MIRPPGKNFVIIATPTMFRFIFYSPLPPLWRLFYFSNRLEFSALPLPGSLVQQEIWAASHRAGDIGFDGAADPVIPQAPGALAVRCVAVHRQAHPVPPFLLCFPRLGVLSGSGPFSLAPVHSGHLPVFHITQLTARVPPAISPAKIAISANASKRIIILYLRFVIWPPVHIPVSP